MALLHTGDRICASCGGMNGRHQPACTGDESVEVISVYTRQQAIEDGILVDCEQAPMGEMRTPASEVAACDDRHSISSLRVANRRGGEPATRPEFGRPLLGCGLDVPCRRQGDSPGPTH